MVRVLALHSLQPMTCALAGETCRGRGGCVKIVHGRYRPLVVVNGQRKIDSVAIYSLP